MENLLDVGIEFESFDAFQAAIEQYENANFVQFSRIDSRSVEKAQENSVTKTYSPDIKFTQLTYACTFGPRKGQSKSTGARNASSRKIDCPVRIRVSSTPDGQRLVIRESKLDCHNHEISEEQYKSLSRQKQLDEETEMEIYNLVSMHEDKRLARMLIRDKLTKETGRSISVKDILNIEKKITRKLEQEKRDENDAGASADDDEDKEDKGEYEQMESTDAGDEQKEEDQDEEGSETVEKKKLTKGQKSASLGRPQRTRREPRRFRDPLENGEKVLHTSKGNVVSFVSPEEAEELDAIDFPSSSRKVRIKEEPSQRGRKRKTSNSEGHSDSLKIQERKLAIEEEMLEMEKKKMKILNDIVKKLDKIIENQKNS